jgi:hypothetical protein
MPRLRLLLLPSSFSAPRGRAQSPPPSLRLKTRPVFLPSPFKIPKTETHALADSGVVPLQRAATAFCRAGMGRWSERDTQAAARTRRHSPQTQTQTRGEFVSHEALIHTQTLTHTLCTHRHNTHTQGDTQTQTQSQAQAH